MTEVVQAPNQAFTFHAKGVLPPVGANGTHPPAPNVLPVDPSGIPQSMKDRRQWAVWKFVWDEKHEAWTKKPSQVNGHGASSTDPRHWTDFQTALQAYQSNPAVWGGVAFAFTQEDGMVFMDWDDCTDDVRDKLLLLSQSFTERSPSGTGFHTVALGTKPGASCTKADTPLVGLKKFEMYETARFMCTTGHLCFDSAVVPCEVRPAQEFIDEAYNKFLQDSFSGSNVTVDLQGWEPRLTDEQLWQEMSCSQSAQKLLQLFGGDTSQYNGDHSSADMALCNMLAWWTAGNIQQMDSLFRKSKLIRPKWDERRGAATYGEKTLVTALMGMDEAGFEGSQQVRHVLAQSSASGWEEVVPLDVKLAPVLPFKKSFLPEPYQDWAVDIAERMQVPLEFVGVPILCVVASVLGRKVGLRPKEHDSWTVYSVLWGMVVGTPGVLKSPALNEVISMLRKLEMQAADIYERQQKDRAHEIARNKILDSINKAEAKTRLASDANADISDLQVHDPEPPTLQRYTTNDTTYEKAGELLAENPNGFLLVRDELMSFVKTLDKEENTAARGFFLQCANGSGSYVFDRVMRGSNIRVPHTIMSIIGGTQPAKLAAYVQSTQGGNNDDGMLQRFQLTVWPDIPKDWTDVDRLPDYAARHKAFEALQSLSLYQPSHHNCEHDIRHDGSDGDAFFRLDADAQSLMNEERTALEISLRDGRYSDNQLGHYSKYRGLLPTIALLHHVGSERSGAVGKDAVIAAKEAVEYFRSHANRMYCSENYTAVRTALALLKKMKEGKITSPFKGGGYIKQNGWAGLNDTNTINDALKLLEQNNYVREEQFRPDGGVGRPRLLYVINPDWLLQMSSK
jgi:Protein of unknown function (DUF3987)/NrS-1  polymerase HBD domain